MSAHEGSKWQEEREKSSNYNPIKEFSAIPAGVPVHFSPKELGDINTFVTQQDSQWEYILESNPESEWQKKLNQWRHMYELQIVTLTAIPDQMGKPSYVTILLRRKRNG